MSINSALDTLPTSLLARSGSVFYSGRAAFERTSPVYLLGLNPGGDPVAQAGNTVARHIAEHRVRSQPWSAYADDSWEGARPGTWGMHPRVLHLLQALRLDPQLTPASNVIFVRSRDEAALRAEKVLLIRDCWPVHAQVLDTVRPSAVICFGSTAGAWVRQRMNATTLIDTYVETNRRGWTSVAHRGDGGVAVITTTHPGRADWRNPDADPTPMIKRVLASSS